MNAVAGRETRVRIAVVESASGATCSGGDSYGSIAIVVTLWVSVG